MLRFFFLMLLAFPVFAEPVVLQINGATVYSGDCVAPAPPPPPPPPPPVEPPVVDPFECVQTPMLNCASRPFPVIVQEIVSLYGSRVVAIKVRVPASGRGYIQTMQYAGVTASRTVTLSTLPGEMTAPRECVKSGFETTGNAWATTPGVRGECLLPPGKDVYINIQASNCPAGTRCKIYIKAN